VTATSAIVGLAPSSVIDGRLASSSHPSLRLGPPQREPVSILGAATPSPAGLKGARVHPWARPARLLRFSTGTSMEFTKLLASESTKWRLYSAIYRGPRGRVNGREAPETTDTVTLLGTGDIWRKGVWLGRMERRGEDQSHPP
jgi:hypothetical protein